MSGSVDSALYAACAPRLAAVTLPARGLWGLLAAVLGILVAAGTALACDIDADCFLFNPCLVNARCLDGECHYNNRNCNDSDICTTDRCDPLGVGCVHEPVCPSDGIACNGEEYCSIYLFGGLCGREPPHCDDGDACTIDSCVEPTGCQHVPVNCADANQCTLDSCDATLGCVNEPIEGCCRTAADCPVDACTEPPRCTAGACAAGTPISCDDDDPRTVDGCDPTTGCTHVPRMATTTSTVPGGSGGICTGDGDCVTDDDPCTEERCIDGRCTTRDLVGFERLACVCRRPLPAACAGEQYPRKLERRAARACAAVSKARDETAKRQKRLLGKASRQFGKAARLAGKAATKGALTGLCAAAASARMTDGASRVVGIQGGS
jgi:hypothetical protein